MDPWSFRLYSFSHFVKVSITKFYTLIQKKKNCDNFDTNLAQYIFSSDINLFGFPCVGWEHLSVYLILFFKSNLILEL